MEGDSESDTFTEGLLHGAGINRGMKKFFLKNKIFFLFSFFLSPTCIP